MLWTVLFTFYVNGEVLTYPMIEAEDLSSCKAKAAYIFKRIKIKPDHVMCARKA